MPDRVKKTKCGGGGVLRRKKLRGGMPERGKEDKMQVGVCRRGVKKTKCGRLRKKIEGGGMPETKCGGGVLRKTI